MRVATCSWDVMHCVRLQASTPCRNHNKDDSTHSLSVAFSSHWDNAITLNHGSSSSSDQQPSRRGDVWSQWIGLDTHTHTLRVSMYISAEKWCVHKSTLRPYHGPYSACVAGVTRGALRVRTPCQSAWCVCVWATTSQLAALQFHVGCARRIHVYISPCRAHCIPL